MARTRQTPPIPAEVTAPLETDGSGESLPASSRVSLQSLLRRPLVFVPLLVLAGLIAGYAVGALRLAARERKWEAQRGELEREAAGLESSLLEAQSQEISYRVLVSISRVVVDLYDRNFGLAAEELRKVRGALETTPRASGSELAQRVDAFQAELDELSRRVEQMSLSSRETMRDIEREVTRVLFPEGS